VEYTVPRDSDVDLAIYDLSGRTVATLARGAHGPGRYVVSWKGDASGAPAPAGLYFVRFHTPAGDFVRRLVVAN
jgi:hypothetical protein